MRLEKGDALWLRLKSQSSRICWEKIVSLTGQASFLFEMEKLSQEKDELLQSLDRAQDIKEVESTLHKNEANLRNEIKQNIAL